MAAKCISTPVRGCLNFFHTFLRCRPRFILVCSFTMVTAGHGGVVHKFTCVRLSVELLLKYCDVSSSVFDASVASYLRKTLPWTWLTHGMHE